MVAAAEQLAHRTARADLGAGCAGVVGQRRGGRAGIDAAGVEVELGVLDVRREQRFGRAQLGRGHRVAALRAEDQAAVGLAVEGERVATALVQIEEQLEGAAPDRFHHGVVRADHETLVAARGSARQPGGLAQRHPQSAPRAGGGHGDADDAAADHDDVGGATHSRPASAA